MQGLNFPSPHEQPTMSVEEAGCWLDLSRPSAYKAAARGEIPTIRIGRRVLVPTAALRKMLSGVSGSSVGSQPHRSDKPDRKDHDVPTLTPSDHARPRQICRSALASALLIGQSVRVA
jgi:excisionase family DNA binding protein